MNAYNNIDVDFTPSDWVRSDETIKVIGVGGGGCNAVSYMYQQKITGCSFIVCNTDSQALAQSPVPVKIQLGKGLGAGTDPTKGRNAAIEAQSQIEEVVLNGKTRMLFITAGMGGGTGTGASPVIAKMAKDKGILTVAVVTLPFKNEGNESMSKAIDGIRELEKNVDSLLIINNEKLYDFYGNLLVQDAFPKTGTGRSRLEEAVKAALESPLLNDFDLSTAKNMLVNISVGHNDQGIRMDELRKIDELIAQKTNKVNRFKRGIIYDDDPDVGDRVSITIIATGFEISKLSDITDVSLGNIIEIDKNFTYDPYASLSDGEISIPDNGGGSPRKIGYNTEENIRTFRFTEDERPVLLVNPGESLGELEAVPAIRRSAKAAADTL